MKDEWDAFIIEAAQCNAPVEARLASLEAMELEITSDQHVTKAERARLHILIDEQRATLESHA